MASIAFIGPDGAGKTTLARWLQESFPARFKYMYMGINVEASEVSLWSSRVVEYLKRRLSRKSEASPPQKESLAAAPRLRRNLIGLVWATARLVNRLADEWYRQLVSWTYQAQGYIVLYDRHYWFDFAMEENAQPLDERLHRWFLAHFYPRPDLTIYLDAPAQALFDRKREKSVEDLERRRQAFLRRGERLPGFVRVDGAQPLDKVYEEVTARVLEFCRRRCGLPTTEERLETKGGFVRESKREEW